MIHEPQPQANTPRGRQDNDIGEPCTGCGADVVADFAADEGGLNCARCGQWQVLCDDCMPSHVSEYARDAVWCCPECSEKPLDS